MRDKNKEDKEKNLVRKEIEDIERKLGEENTKLKKYDSIQESIASLKKSLDRCSDILANSMEPGEGKESFLNLLSDNDECFKKNAFDFDDQIAMTKQTVFSLEDKRDALLSEYRSDETESDDSTGD